MSNNRHRRATILQALSVITLTCACVGCLVPHTAQTGKLSPALQSLQADLDAIFDEPKYANAFWGVRVEKADGTVLYDRFGHKQFVPASNMKLFTSAAALEILGPDFTYETRLEAIGTVAPDGTLEGHLLIVGSGDPSLGAWHPDKSKDSRQLLADWVAKIKQAGIQKIAGDIIGDGRCFTREYYSSNWAYDDLNFWYGAGSSGLAIEENAYRCVIKPGKSVGDPATITCTPVTDYFSVVNETKTIEAGGKSNADSTWNLTEGNVKRFIGTIALDKDEINERGSVWDGARYAAHLLGEELERQGVSVGGQPLNIRAIDDPGRIDNADANHRKTIAIYTSPPLRELVKVIDKPSHNFFADQVLRTLGLQIKGEGSFKAGVEVVRSWLEQIGAPQPETLQMYDGSGLARDDFFQPRQMCHLLRHMGSSETAGEAFVASLPIAGVDGSLSKRMKDAPTKENVRAKTGYISNVRCLAGYVTTADGQELVFAMMCNQYTVPTAEVNESQDRACKVLALFTEHGSLARPAPRAGQPD